MTTDPTIPALDFVELNGHINPWPTYAQTIGACPVVHSPDYGGFWAVAGYSAVRAATVDSASFCSGMGVTIPKVQNSIPALPTESDPPVHRGYRQVVVPHLRPDVVSAWVGDMKDIANSCIDAFIERGTAELRTELASHVPPKVITRMMALPDDLADRVQTLSDQITERASADSLIVARSAAGELLRLVHQLVDDSTGKGNFGLLSKIVDGKVGDRPVEHDEAAGMLYAMLIAGHETTVNGISSALRLLGANHDAKRALIEDQSRIPAAIDEVLRIESPVQMMARTVVDDVEFENVRMAKGDAVGLMFGIANHDESVYTAPHRFDIQRREAPHVAFGHGIHRCLGEHLAKAEMIAVLEVVLERIPDFELTEGVTMLPNSAMNRGVASVPVRFSPSPRPGGQQ